MKHTELHTHVSGTNCFPAHHEFYPKRVTMPSICKCLTERPSLYFHTISCRSDAQFLERLLAHAHFDPHPGLQLVAAPVAALIQPS